MKDAEDKHREAMRFAERAEIARLGGNQAEAASLLRRAFETEREAAQLLFADPAMEPTRSVLFRSAAVLALDCEEDGDAERLAAQGLAGNPPEEIAVELREVLEEATFRRHLSTRGVRLLCEEFQVSMVGRAIASGIARVDAVVSRVRSLEDLVFRIAERKAGIEYRTSGRRRKEVAQSYEMFLSAPRSGSFALSIRLGQTNQSSFPGMGNAEPVVDELLACLELFGAKRQEELHERIPNEAYYANFVSLARRVAPDGDAVRWVGFTSIRGGKERHVELRSEARPAPKDLATPPSMDTKESGDKIRIRGVLRWADATREIETVRIVDSDGQSHHVRVPRGVDDIVKPHWLEEVIVTGSRGPRGSILLEDIESVRGE